MSTGTNILPTEALTCCPKTNLECWGKAHEWGKPISLIRRCRWCRCAKPVGGGPDDCSNSISGLYKMKNLLVNTMQDWVNPILNGEFLLVCTQIVRWDGRNHAPNIECCLCILYSHEDIPHGNWQKCKKIPSSWKKPKDEWHNSTYEELTTYI